MIQVGNAAIIMAMIADTAPVNKARQGLCGLIRRGRVVEITSHGEIVATLIPASLKSKPWRMPRDQRKGPVGNLDQPCWEGWE